MIIHVFLAKDRLYNAVAEEMKTEKALFPQSYPDDLIRRHVNVVVDTLWYIDAGIALSVANVAICDFLS